MGDFGEVSRSGHHSRSLSVWSTSFDLACSRLRVCVCSWCWSSVICTFRIDRSRCRISSKICSYDTTLTAAMTQPALAPLNNALSIRSLSLQVPGKMQHVLCTGNVCSKSTEEYLRTLANSVHIVRGDMDVQTGQPESERESAGSTTVISWREVVSVCVCFPV